jgi:hypothetical protein
MSNPSTQPAARAHVGTKDVAAHPDLFNPDEAAAYLHLDSVRGLETLRNEYGLIGHKGVNKSYIYHREDLDAVALRIVGKDRTWAAQNGGGLKIGGGR